MLIYTSGTSGTPRGAMLTHRALLADLEHVRRIEPPPTGPDDVVLLVLPLFHIFGLNTGLGMVAAAGATGVLVDRFDAAGSAEIIRRHRVSSLVGAPPMYVAWSLLPDAGEVFASVRLAVSGAAPLPVEVLRRFLARAGHLIYEGYGLTETAPSVTSTPLQLRAEGRLGRTPGARGRGVARRRQRRRGRPGRPGRDPGPRRRTSSPATGRTDARDPTPRAGGARVTSPWPMTPGI